MLKQFNPQDVDYGGWIERERRAFIEARLKSPYFLYSVCTTLALLLTAVVCVKLWIDHRRAMWITSADTWILSFSECASQQEAMLLMSAGSWIETGLGRLVLEFLDSRAWAARLVLTSGK